MKHLDTQNEVYDQLLLDHLLSLPLRILKNHDLSDLSHLVLHHISRDQCFGFDKSAYFIDNPDFDHLKGVAGYCRLDDARLKPPIWDKPISFKEAMKDAQFLTKIKNYLDSSFVRKKIDIHNSNDLKELGKNIGMKNPDFYMWDAKHGNHGLLIFDCENQLSQMRKKLLCNIVPLLSFCPVFKA